ncbi:hypothetical protein [Domibacillus tundrae]|uniref:hypothetical protein n=1 Tax=Domibacillus tundrae TaxID=1587527 RepID=UPI000A7AA6DF|nr:hypothetical protein [Domibacillus tundrae]
MMKKAMVLGATGGIGYALVKELVEQAKQKLLLWTIFMRMDGSQKERERKKRRKIHIRKKEKSV